MKLKRGNRRFDGQEKPLTIILARGQNVRYWILRPWMLLAGAAAAFGLAAAGVAAPFLLLSSPASEEPTELPARMQQSYEDRISSLRAELDRVTRDQKSDQKALERKITELLDRQERLTLRHSWLSPILERAEELNTSAKPIPVPTPRPQVQEPAGENRVDHTTITGSAFASIATPKIPWPVRSERPFDQPDELFRALDRSLRSLETDQAEQIDRLTEETYRKIDAIDEALGSAGIKINSRYGQNAGGPFIPISGYLPIEERARGLDEALNRLQELKRKIRYMPIAHPVPGAHVTSNFGARRDPILGRTAFHAGLDFRASPGSPVRAAAAGIVVEAGWQGGYGRMVEIDHGNGIRTRYAHLSKVLVSVGDRITNGGIIGQVGSSGRSTGPHLHYEVRRKDAPVNPRKLIKLGEHLAKLL
ncbi:M23 family metallopeptidase [Chelativorans sp. J32]|uniref:M23 family metallopeptidase n=1 Tax=Chelativorans sp. J32 TaxID=935840 RepID=UPI000685899D|nr:M23 family metallopeptidase [Chelativorans sp. J32]